uniref:Uncharacterized protein n=1 Tax=Arundo donax TaxID=35708 RepID=A0A0A9F7Q8_ARUDO
MSQSVKELTIASSIA